MTHQQANELKVGDIIEHSTDINYWLAKIVRRDAFGDWRVKNSGEGVFSCVVMTHPDDFTLVGHSDTP